MRLAPLLTAVALLAAGCAPTTRVTLLPQADHPQAAVEVTARQRSTRLAQPYASAAVRQQGPELEQLDAATVHKRYPALLAVMPPPAERFELKFITGGTRLTPESTAELSDVLASAIARAGGEIVVIGHTDRVGTLEANDALSLRRAEAVRALIVERGFEAARVRAVGRGEREPQVPTEDDVDEPRNRRVEIVVR
ncbi:MAG: OmpA family protein [Rubrivivax sp.]|nr:OmpA family protein [Rubrivivax sp.]HNT84564.1 OmpA family protein [Ottowia sp.]HOZ94055.1 OmpA family protein [Ottowia sp.]HQO52557.1 OmpA family protein [Ottowia sp.]HQQ52829.1 OmpA family protein [Ottowia sp.]